MESEQLRRRIVEKYGFVYSVHPCVAPEDDLLTIDGMNKEGVYYIVAKLSDGKVLSEIYEDFRDVWFPTIQLFPDEDYREVGGNLQELCEKGESPRRLFFSMQNWLHCLPKENRHERLISDID